MIRTVSINGIKSHIGVLLFIIIIVSIVLGTFSLPISVKAQMVPQDKYDYTQNLLYGAENNAVLGAVEAGGVAKPPDPIEMTKNVFDNDYSTGWFAGSANQKEAIGDNKSATIKFDKPTLVDTVEYRIDVDNHVQFIGFSGVKTDGTKINLIDWDNKNAGSRNQMANNSDRSIARFNQVELTEITLWLTTQRQGTFDNEPVHYTLFELRAYNHSNAVNSIDGDNVVVIPQIGTKQVKYSAMDLTAKNIPNQDIIFEVDKMLNGVTFDNTTGVLSVSSDAQPGVFTLTATTNNGKSGAKSVSKKIVVNKEKETDQEAVIIAKQWLTFDTISSDNINNVIHDLMLYRKDVCGTDIKWTISDVDAVNESGKINRRLPNGEVKKVKLTATIFKGVVSDKVEFNIIIPPFEALKDTSLFTDEDFYGKWDGEKWIKESVINYSYNDKLNEISQAVKNNDYNLAKTLYLKFTKDKFENLSYSNVPKASIIRSKLAINDITSGGIEPIAIINVGTTPKIIQVPVSLENNAVINFNITSMKKDKAIIQFNSRENKENDAKTKQTLGPILEVTMASGEVKRFASVKDTYIQGGKYEFSNFGENNYLQVSDFSDEFSLWTEGTRISLIQFNPKLNDIYGKQGLDDKAQIKSAKLILYGNNISNTGDKEIAIFKSNIRTFATRGITGDENISDEYRVNLRNYPNKVVSFQGLEGGVRWENPNNVDDEYHWSAINRFYFINNMVGDYLASKDENFSYHSLRQAVDYMNDIGHTGQANRPFESTFRVGPLLDNIKHLNKTESYTPEVNTSLVKALYCIGNQLSQHEHFNAGMNMGGSELDALLRLTMKFPEFKEYDHFIERCQTYMKILFGLDGYNYGLTFNDGSYGESTSGYAYATFGGLLSVYKNALSLGLQLNSEYSDILKQYSYYLGSVTTPDGKEVKFGDGGGNYTVINTKDEKINTYIGQFAELINDPTLKYIANNGKAGGTAPDYTSKLFDVSGRMSMRSAWEPNALFAFMNFDGGGSHGHFDDNSISISAYGNNLIVDQGGGSYDGTNGRKFKVSSLAHNTLTQITTSDGNRLLQQKTRKGELSKTPSKINDWVTNNSFDFISTTLPDNTYVITEFDDKKEPIKSGNAQNISYTRNVLFVRPSYWIVSDYVEDKDGGVNNKYELGWNFEQNNNLSIGLEDKKAITNYYDSANIQIVTADPQETNVWLEDSIYSSGKVGMFKYLAQNKISNTEKVNFDNVLFPTKNGDKKSNVQVERLSIKDADPTTATALKIIRISENGQIEEDYYYYSHEEKSIRKFADYQTDGKLAFSSYKDQNIILTSGTFIKKGEIDLIKLHTPIDHLTISCDNSVINLSTTKSHDSKALSNGLIYSEADVRKVYLNGKDIEFTQTGNYVTIKALTMDYKILEIKKGDKTLITLQGSTYASDAQPVLVILSYNESGMLVGMDAIKVKKGLNEYVSEKVKGDVSKNLAFVIDEKDFGFKLSDRFIE